MDPPASTDVVADEAVVDDGVPYRRSPAALWRATLDGLVLLAGDGPRDARRPTSPIFVEGSMGIVWELLAVPITRPDLAAAIARELGADEEVVAADLVPILRGLVDAGLVVRG